MSVVVERRRLHLDWGWEIVSELRLVRVKLLDEIVTQHEC
jgi:hypothetical protein